MLSIAAYLVTTGVAGDTTFSPESGKFPYAFWQGIADGVGDQNFRRSRLSSQGLARVMRPAIATRCPDPQRSAHWHPARCLTDGRTALSEYRRRSPGRNSASHRPKYLLPVTAVAITAILGVTLAGYLVLRATRRDRGRAAGKPGHGGAGTAAPADDRHGGRLPHDAPRRHPGGRRHAGPGGGGQLPRAGPRHRAVHRVEHDVVVWFRPQHAVQLPGQHLYPRERVALGRGQRQRRLRHTAGPARVEDGHSGGRLADQPGHPDQVGPRLHPVGVWDALQRMVFLAGARLVLTRPR